MTQAFPAPRSGSKSSLVHLRGSSRCSPARRKREQGARGCEQSGQRRCTSRDRAAAPRFVRGLLPSRLPRRSARRATCCARLTRATSSGVDGSGLASRAARHATSSGVDGSGLASRAARRTTAAGACPTGSRPSAATTRHSSDAASRRAPGRGIAASACFGRTTLVSRTRGASGASGASGTTRPRIQDSSAHFGFDVGALVGDEQLTVVAGSHVDSVIRSKRRPREVGGNDERLGITQAAVGAHALREQSLERSARLGELRK